MFRDSHHPNEIFSLQAAEKLLGYRYTSNIILPSRTQKSTGDNINTFREDLDIIFHQNRTENIMYSLISFKNLYDNIASTGTFADGVLHNSSMDSIFYAEVSHDGAIHVWKDVPTSFLKRFYYKEDDVLTLPSMLNSTWPIKFDGRFCHATVNTSSYCNYMYGLDVFGAVTADGTAFVVEREYKRFLFNEVLFSVLSISPVFRNVDPFYLSNYLRGHPIAELFKDNSLYKYKDDRQVYVTLNCSRHKVWTAQVFFNHGIKVNRHRPLINCFSYLIVSYILTRLGI